MLRANTHNNNDGTGDTQQQNSDEQDALFPASFETSIFNYNSINNSNTQSNPISHLEEGPSLEETTSQRESYVIRWLFRAPVFENSLRYFCAFPFQQYRQSSFGEIIRAHNYYLNASAGFPQNHKVCAVANVVASEFFAGAKLVLNYLWPATLTGIIAKDIATYHLSPEQRFGNTIGKVLLGTSDNQDTWSCHFGSDLPGEYLYYFATGIILTAPFVMGAMSVLYHTVVNCSYRAAALTVWDASQSKKLASNVEHSSNHIAGLMTELNKEPLLSRLNGARFFANLADSFSQGGLLLSPNSVRPDLTTIKKDAITILRHISNGPESLSLVERIHARYLLWSLGQRVLLSENILFTGFATTLSLWQLYAYLRLGELVYFKWAGMADYLDEKSRCEADHYVWEYQHEWGDYACLPCGHWKDLYIKDRETLEGCWNATFANPRRPALLAKRVSHILQHDEFIPRVVDLSRQHYTNWTLPQLTMFFNHTLASINRLDVLNLSLPSLNNQRYSTKSQLDVITHFLRRVIIRVLDMRNLGASSELVLSLESAYANSTLLEGINVSGNYLDSQDAYMLGNILPPSISELIVNKNQIDDYSMSKLVASRKNSALTSFVAQGGIYGQATINALADLVSTRQLQSIDLSDTITLALVDFTSIWQASSQPQSSLISFSVNGCQLGDTTLARFVPYPTSSIQSLKWERNLVSDYGINYFFQGLVLYNRSVVKEVDFDSNKFTDLGMSMIGMNLPKTHIEILGLSRNLYSVNGLQDVCTALPSSRVKKLWIAGTAYGDPGAMVVAEALANPNVSLTDIDMSNTGMTDTGGMRIAGNITKSSLENVNLNNNFLTSATVNVFGQAASTWSVRKLYLAGNELDSSTPLAAIIAHSNTTDYIDVSHNPDLGDSPILGITSLLLKPIDDLSFKAIANKTTLNLDERRALRRAKASGIALRVLNLDDVGATADSAAPLCRVLPQSSIARNNIDLDHNLIAGEEVDISNCHVSSANRLSPFGTFRLFAQPAILPAPAANNAADRFSLAQAMLLALSAPSIVTIIIGMLAIYLVYRMIKPLVTTPIQLFGLMRNTSQPPLLTQQQNANLPAFSSRRISHAI